MKQKKGFYEMVVNAKENELGTESFKDGVVVEVEYWDGSTYKAFLVEVNENHDSTPKIISSEDEEVSVEDLMDLGVLVKQEGNEIIVQYLEEVVCVADIDGDYLFEKDLDLIRIQAIEKNTFR